MDVGVDHALERVEATAPHADDADRGQVRRGLAASAQRAGRSRGAVAGLARIAGVRHGAQRGGSSGSGAGVARSAGVSAGGFFSATGGLAGFAGADSGSFAVAFAATTSAIGGLGVVASAPSVWRKRSASGPSRMLALRLLTLEHLLGERR